MVIFGFCRASRSTAGRASGRLSFSRSKTTCTRCPLAASSRSADSKFRAWPGCDMKKRTFILVSRWGRSAGRPRDLNSADMACAEEASILYEPLSHTIDRVHVGKIEAGLRVHGQRRSAEIRPQVRKTAVGRDECLRAGDDPALNGEVLPRL